MSKFISIIGLLIVFASCNLSKQKAIQTPSHVYPPIKTEIYFDDCKGMAGFLGEVIVNNRMDTSLKVGQFKIPHINASFANAKSLFPPDCFIGIGTDELKEIFGEWDYAGKSVDHPAWYTLKNNNNVLVIEVWIRGGIVDKFTVNKGSEVSILK